MRERKKNPLNKIFSNERRHTCIQYIIDQMQIFFFLSLVLLISEIGTMEIRYNRTSVKPVNFHRHVLLIVPVFFFF